MSLLIGQHIKAVLDADPVAKANLKDRVYPVVVTQSAPAFPLVVYSNTGTRPDETKDGNCNDSVTVVLVLLSAQYNEGINLINHIRYLFEGHKAQYAQFEVTDCSLSGSSEDYDDGLAKYVFTISLTFNTIDE